MRRVLCCLLCTSAGDTSGKLMISLQVIEHLDIILVFILCITTCIANGGATRIRHVMVHCSPPYHHHHLHLARLLELRYISHVVFHILFIDIIIFSINDMFYDI
jgi:hypothetical protein